MRGPTIPSARRPWALWNRLTAWSVTASQRPFVGTAYPRARNAFWTTRTREAGEDRSTSHARAAAGTDAGEGVEGAGRAPASYRSSR